MVDGCRIEGSSAALEAGHVETQCAGSGSFRSLCGRWSGSGIASILGRKRILQYFICKLSLVTSLSYRSSKAAFWHLIRRHYRQWHKLTAQFKFDLWKLCNSVSRFYSALRTNSNHKVPWNSNQKQSWTGFWDRIALRANYLYGPKFRSMGRNKQVCYRGKQFAN